MCRYSDYNYSSFYYFYYHYYYYCKWNPSLTLGVAFGRAGGGRPACEERPPGRQSPTRPPTPHQESLLLGGRTRVLRPTLRRGRGRAPPRLSRAILEFARTNFWNVQEPTIKGVKHHPRLSESDRGGWCLTPGGSLRGPPCGGWGRVTFGPTVFGIFDRTGASPGVGPRTSPAPCRKTAPKEKA